MVDIKLYLSLIKNHDTKACGKVKVQLTDSGTDNSWGTPPPPSAKRFKNGKIPYM